MAGERFSTLTADPRPHQRDVGIVGDFIRLIYRVPNNVPTNNRWAKPNKQPLGETQQMGAFYRCWTGYYYKLYFDI